MKPLFIIIPAFLVSIAGFVHLATQRRPPVIDPRDSQIKALAAQRDEWKQKYDKEYLDGLGCLKAALTIADQRDQARAKLWKYKATNTTFTFPPNSGTVTRRGWTPASDTPAWPIHMPVLVLQRDGSWKPVEVQ